MDENLKIEYVSVDDIKPYSGNARLHGDNDISAIVASIEQFGFDDPIGIWSNENIIVEGHGRLEAAKQLGIRKVPCIRLDHLDDEQRRAYSLAHNRTAELSEWDFELLEQELDELKELDFDMSDFGFEDSTSDVGGSGDEQPNLGETGFNYKEQYGVIVMCKDEAEQEAIYNRLVEEGFECKVVAT